MRKFNPDKELKKIQNGNRNKIIFSMLFGIILLTIGYSFALYQVRYSKRIIYTKVAPFSTKDIDILAVYLDNQPTTDFPVKNSGYRYDKIVCDNGSTATFDNINWELVLRAKKKDKCSVYFVKTYKDASGANAPELYQGLIPVTFDSSGNVKVVNIDTSWYNYGSKQWANAVLVDSSNYSKYVKDGKYQSNTTIPMDEILQMYVWIPRYKYQLFNVDNQGVEEQEIQIIFESNTSTTGTVTCEINDIGAETCTGATKGAWYTHPAFRFGSTHLNGIWIGKFESSGNDANLKVIPNVTPLLNVNILYMFTAARNIENTNATKYNLETNEIDTHMIKNIEWGAVAYLTQSKYGRCTADGGCEEVTLNSFEYRTGYANSSQAWSTTDGQKASTTGNMYGIYDLNGGAWEYVMGNIVDPSGKFYSSQAGFVTSPEEKYYDKYEYGASATDHKRGHLGDATREVLKSFGDSYGGWYGDASYYPYSGHSWMIRGERGANTSKAGIFAVETMPGAANGAGTFHISLTAQDGNT